jgi:small subunit ribosomal protein S6
VRRYETLFILRQDLGEAPTKDIIKRFEGIISSGGGDIIETEEWGMRELAYNIRGERRGYYVRLDYASDPPTMNEVERNLKLQDSVLRYLSVLVDDEADVAKAREEIETRRRKIAEAKAAAEARAAAAIAQREEREAAAAEAAGAAAEKAGEDLEAPPDLNEPGPEGGTQQS